MANDNKSFDAKAREDDPQTEKVMLPGGIRFARTPMIGTARVFESAEAGQLDMVKHPPHYTAYPVEVIEMIKAVLGPEGFKAYCFGNEIKYRMRAGLKNAAHEDLAKAMTYKKFREGE